MICPACRRENIEDAAFCAWCGQPIAARPAGPPTETREMARARQQVVENVAKRKDTDIVLSPMWVIGPLVVYILSSVIGSALILAAIIEEFERGSLPTTFPDVTGMMAVGYTVMMTGVLIYVGIFALLTHQLVARQNQHFVRDRSLRSAMLALAKAAAGPGPARYDFLQAIGVLESWVNAPHEVERERSPMLWAIVVLLPGILSFAAISAMILWPPDVWLVVVVVLVLVGAALQILALYMFYFLMKGIHGHSAHWTNFAYQACGVLDRLGYDPRGLYVGTPTKERSFALYLIATLLTGGLFMYYWWYVLVKDPNEHYKAQWLFEDQFLSMIGPRSARPRPPVTTQA